MPTYFRLLFLATLLVAPCLASAQGDILPGNYDLDYGHGSDLTIIKGAGGGLRFEISTVGRTGNICELAGKIHNGRAFLKGDEQGPCIVTFDPVIRGGIKVDFKGTCGYYCGVNVGFNGLYLSPKPECTEMDIGQLRATFKGLYDQKEYGQAVATLAPVLERCDRALAWPDAEWLRNDLALARHKMGDDEGCRATLAQRRISTHDSDESLRSFYHDKESGEQAVRLAKAIRVNMKLCGMEVKMRTPIPPATGKE